MTLRVSQFSFAHVFHIVSSQRGGGPLHFWLEHFLQSWWPGLVSLRVPSLVFMCIALPAVALVARELAGKEVAAGVVLLTAVSPIPLSYTTFGRPHTMLFAWLMWGTVLALRAARTADRRYWIAAGALLGSAIFVHPTAPLYAWTAFAAALVYAGRRPSVLAREAWPGLLALLVTFLPYWVKTLGVLNERYGLAPGARRGRTFTGRPVWEDALHFVAPGRHDLNYFAVLALGGLIALAAQRRWRVLAFCVLTIAAPVVFFSIVPAGGDSAIFFDRYMIPVTPAFMVVVVVGCAAVARLALQLRLLVLAVLIAGLVGVAIRYDDNRRADVSAIGLNGVTHALAHQPAGTVLFGSTGTGGASFASFDYGHPANILDHYIALRIPSLQLVDDDACARAAPFATGPAVPRTGLWLFFAAAPDQDAAAATAFAQLRGVQVQRPAPRFFAVRSAAKLPPRRLIELGIRIRKSWQAAVPANARVAELLIADRQVLAAPSACPSYGDLGDPDITPHWPPVHGPQ